MFDSARLWADDCYMTTTHTHSDLSSLTVHHGRITATDQHGDMFGPTSCGIPAGTYCSEDLARVNCSECLTALVLTPSTFDPFGSDAEANMAQAWK